MCKSSHNKQPECALHGCGSRCNCQQNCQAYRCKGCSKYMVPASCGINYSCCLIKPAPKKLLCLRRKRMLRKGNKSC